MQGGGKEDEVKETEDDGEEAEDDKKGLAGCGQDGGTIGQWHAGPGGEDGQGKGDNEDWLDGDERRDKTATGTKKA